MDDKGKKDAGRSHYNRQYYEEHAAEIQGAHKRRYQDDPEYRESQIEQAKARYASGAPGRRLRRRLGEQIRRHNLAKKEWKIRERHILVEGVMLQVFTVGALAKAIGRTMQTIYSWEKRGVLPEATARDSSGRRWYSQGYIDKAKSVVEESRDEAWGLEPLKDRMREVFGSAAFERRLGCRQEERRRRPRK